MKNSLLVSTLLLLLSVNVYADSETDTVEDTAAVEMTTDSEVSGDQSQWYQNQNTATDTSEMSDTSESTEDSSESSNSGY